jgi:hypothetical protein
MAKRNIPRREFSNPDDVDERRRLSGDAEITHDAARQQCNKED